VRFSKTKTPPKRRFCPYAFLFMQFFTNARRFRKWMAGPFLIVHLPITLLPEPSHQESDLDFLATGAVSSSDPLRAFMLGR